MQVRKMEAVDLEAVGALARQLGYEPTAAIVRDGFARLQAHPDHLLLVAELDGLVAGWLHASAVHLLYTEPFVYLASLVVDEARRGRGAGRALVEAAEAWARSGGYVHVRLRSRLSRGGAHRFYVRLGYAKEKTQYAFSRRLD